MNAERLLKMAEFLEALPPHKFDFDSYVNMGDKEPAEALAAPEEHCGTTACAVGWMPAIFPKEIEWRRDSEEYSTLYPAVLGTVSFWSGIQMQISEFLDVSLDEYEFLFLPDGSRLDSYATAAQVAAQIREFVATDGANERDWRIL